MQFSHASYFQQIVPPLKHSCLSTSILQILLKAGNDKTCLKQEAVANFEWHKGSSMSFEKTAFSLISHFFLS